MNTRQSLAQTSDTLPLGEVVSTLPETDTNFPRERLQHLLSRAWQLLECSPLEASAPAREAELLARRIGDNRSWAHSHLIWGVSSLYGADAHEALTLFSRALAGYRFLGDEQGQWWCMKAMTYAWRFLGDGVQSREIETLIQQFADWPTYAASAAWLRWFETDNVGKA